MQQRITALPLLGLGKGINHAIAQRTAWHQQRRLLFAFEVNKLRRVARFIFW
ncbi:MAG: hypothetical protein ACR5LF_02890 [Symbiopectobacterium sp.]